MLSQNDLGNRNSYKGTFLFQHFETVYLTNKLDSASSLIFGDTPIDRTLDSYDPIERYITFRLF